MSAGRTNTPTLAKALRVLSAQAEDADDGIAAIALQEAASRLEQLHADLVAVAPALSAAAGKASRRSVEGKAFRAACDRLVAEVIAP
jgi:hypothetical protein